MTPSSTRADPRPIASDVIVVGGGLIGMACAVALDARGIDVTLVGQRLAGEASPAAAGLLAPGVERASGAAQLFAIAARDRYPAFVEMLEESTDIRVPMLREGILEIALDEEAAELLRGRAGDASWMSSAELAKEEPALAHAAGALLHARDGAIDNVTLVRALRAHLAHHPRIVLVPSLVKHIDVGHVAPVIELENGERIEADRVVLAAGAWVGRIQGLDREIPVEPVRGQMLALNGAPLRHPIYGPHGYIVPRAGDGTLVGATMEHVGFEVRTTVDGLDQLSRAAREICPALGTLSVTRSWAGLRPVTPDLQPIIGADPDAPSLIYACGHSRNGILLAPLTGDVVADLIVDDASSFDLSPFAITRFA